MTEAAANARSIGVKSQQVPSFGSKINVQRVMDDNCERGRSAKSVERLEVTLAAHRCHCRLPTGRGSKEALVSGAHGEHGDHDRARLLKR